MSVKKLKLVTEKANAEDKVLFFKELKTLAMDLCKSDEIIHNLIPSLLMDALKADYINAQSTISLFQKLKE